MVKLAQLRKNDKFKWNNVVYTIFQFEGQMVEVYGNNKWHSWPNWAIVERVIHN